MKMTKWDTNRLTVIKVMLTIWKLTQEWMKSTQMTFLVSSDIIAQNLQIFCYKFVPLAE